MPKKIMESREQLRTAMIDAAERIITEDGAGALTARRLASDLGIAVGTTYNVFRQMDDLIGEVNSRTIAKITGVISAVDTTEHKGVELLMAYADAYIGFVTSNENTWAALFVGDIDPESESHKRNLSQTLRLFGFIEEALRAVSPQTDQHDIEASARALWAAVHGMLSLMAHGRHTILGLGNVREAIQILITNHVAGMRANQ